ncbi:hypothetical protein CCP3SC5AM1_2550002 [Gammaproteobacteria bacterium]
MYIAKVDRKDTEAKASKPENKKGENPATNENSNTNEIRWIESELSLMVDKAEAALLNDGRESIYQRGIKIVRPIKISVPTTGAVKRPEGAITLIEIEAHYLLKRFTSATTWLKYESRKNRWTKIVCPRLVVDTYLSSVGEWKLPVLRAVVQHPVMEPNGRIISKSGYDADTGLLIDISGKWPIIENPTREDAVAAIEQFRHLLRYYPWSTPVDFSVALSLMISPIARAMLPATPLHAVEAPEAGTGKSLLVNVASILATGNNAVVMDYGRDPDEAEKRLNGLLLSGDPFIAIDNVEHPLQGSTLCQTVSEEARQIRQFGKLDSIKTPMTAFLTATGNNLVISKDLVRRSLVCRLDAKTERPELRTIDQNLLAEVKERRRELVGHVLTIISAYQLAGAPNVVKTAIGSFDEWNRMVRSAIVWAGEADPVESQELTKGEDPAREALYAIFSAWNLVIGKDPVTVAEVIRRCEHNQELRDAVAMVAERRGNIDGRILGNWLTTNKDRQAEKLLLIKVASKRNIASWSIIEVKENSTARPITFSVNSVKPNENSGLGGYGGYGGQKSPSREKCLSTLGYSEVLVDVDVEKKCDLTFQDLQVKMTPITPITPKTLQNGQLKDASLPVDFDDVERF